MPIDARALAWLVLPALLCRFTAHADELSPPEIYRKVVRSTLALKVTTAAGERFVGAGFVVFRPDLAVTALHVIRDAAEIHGVFSDGQDAEVGQVLASDPVHDLALLQILGGPRPPLGLRLDPPEIATRLYAIGSPRGYSFSISDGILGQIQEIDGYDQYQLTCPFSPGNSGGPVVDASGRVVGVAAWTKIGAQNLNFAIPAAYAADLAAEGDRALVGPAVRDPSPPNDSMHQVAAVSTPAASAPAISTTDSGQGDAAAYARFLELIHRLAGRDVHISVSAKEVHEDFQCRVPVQVLPAPDAVAANEKPATATPSPRSGANGVTLATGNMAP